MAAASIFNATNNATVVDDNWQAPMSLTIAIGVPVAICLIPCCLAMMPLAQNALTSSSSSNLGLALAFPIIFCVCCISAVLALVGVVVGLMSMLPFEQADPNGLVLVVLAAVTLLMWPICILCCCVLKIFNSCCCNDDDNDSVAVGCLFITSILCWLCSATSSRHREAERERRRQEEEEGPSLDGWRHHSFSQANPYKGRGSDGDTSNRQPAWNLQRGLSFLAPNEFVCPVTLTLMDDPVTVVASGINYERRAIDEWLKSHPRRDPKTNVEFDSDLTFVPNPSLREQIRAWSAAPDQQQALIALESETDEQASRAAKSEAAELRRELCRASCEDFLRVHVWDVGRDLLDMDVDELRALKLKADALRSKDAADAEAAAVLPPSARGVTPEWISSSTQEELQSSETAAASDEEIAAPQSRPSATLAQQRPAGLRRGASGSAVVDAVRDLVSMATSEASPIVRISSGRLSLASGQNALRRERTREMLEAVQGLDLEGGLELVQVEADLQQPEAEPHRSAEQEQVTVSIVTG